ncbi:MAG TPA: hypothetical protein VN851_08820 [Thermoanaerobaculia bacterium]|nr:hypothetical protein [Thermoanaerobaculia bacterium]
MPTDDKTDRDTGARRAKRLLPLILLASMMAIASILEPILFGKVFAATKIPLAILLAWVFFRPLGRRDHASLP